MKLIFVIGVLTFLNGVSSGRGQVAIKSPEKDIPGSKDSRFLRRIEGSYIVYYKKTAFDELKIGLDRITFDYEKQKLNEFRTRLVKGTHETFVYVLPGHVSTLQAVQSCERELRNHGVLEILFQGSKRQNQLDDGYDRFVAEIYQMDSDDPATSFMRRGGDTRYFASRLPRPDGEFFITLLATVSAEGQDKTIVPKSRVGVRMDLLQTRPETEAED
jgi:hypothetical protein